MERSRRRATIASATSGAIERHVRVSSAGQFGNAALCGGYQSEPLIIVWIALADPAFGPSIQHAVTETVDVVGDDWQQPMVRVLADDVAVAAKTVNALASEFDLGECFE